MLKGITKYGGETMEQTTIAKSMVQRSDTKNPVGGPIFLSGEPNYGCLHPLDLSQCHFTPSAHPLMWFFNRQIGTCEVLYYAGCWGNANRFESEEECKATCIGEYIRHLHFYILTDDITMIYGSISWM